MSLFDKRASFWEKIVDGGDKQLPQTCFAGKSSILNRLKKAGPWQKERWIRDSLCCLWTTVEVWLYSPNTEWKVSLIWWALSELLYLLSALIWIVSIISTQHFSRVSASLYSLVAQQMRQGSFKSMGCSTALLCWAYDVTPRSALSLSS